MEDHGPDLGKDIEVSNNLHSAAGIIIINLSGRGLSCWYWIDLGRLWL